MAKQILLNMAKEASYWTLSLADLEATYETSSAFMATGRLQTLESDWFLLTELHFYLSILTCHDSEAKLMLQRIVDKFGADSNRVTTLRATYIESTQGPEVLKKFLEDLDPSVDRTSVKKREIAKIKSTGKWRDYIVKLTELVDQNPIDTETWSELAEAYANSGNYGDAVRCLGQVLVIQPFAYPVFSRIGELRHLQAIGMLDGIQGSLEHLMESVSNFSRSVELCPNYSRGWSGIYVVTTKLLQWPKTPNVELYQKLNTQARDQLEVIVADGDGQPQDLEVAKKIIAL